MLQAGPGFVFADEVKKLLQGAELLRADSPACAETLEAAAALVQSALAHWLRARAGS